MSTNNYANSEQLIDILQAQQVPILGAGGGFAPIGTLAFYDGTVAPQGWLACDGTVYNISDYPELAAHYASHHGASNFYGGNGTTTFAVPDLQGEFLRGSGTNSHTNQGSGGAIGEHQDGTEVPYMSSRFSDGYVEITGNEAKAEPTNTDYVKDNAKLIYTTMSTYSSTVSNGNYTTRPTNTSFLICVKATVSGNPEGHVYSMDEQIVGTTEDGETLYELTLKGNVTCTQSRTYVRVSDLSQYSIKQIHSVSGYIIELNITKFLPYTDIDCGVSIAYAYPQSNDLSLLCYGMADRSNSYRIVIQYTKTQS